MTRRELHVAMLPGFIRREGMSGSAVCVVDLLRASTTMVRALESGAPAIRIVMEPGDALRERDAMGVAAVAAGERSGVAPEGFDLGNSPAEFTPERVRGKTVVFTTTNGTRVVGAAKDAAAAMVIGCLQNRRAVAEHLAGHRGPAVVMCAGTNGRIALEDVLAAGAIMESVAELDKAAELTDSARVCVAAWAGVRDDPTQLAKTVGESAGAKNLVKIGLGADVAECLRTDVSRVVPRWNGAAIVAG